MFLQATRFFSDVFGDPDGAVSYAERVLAAELPIASWRYKGDEALHVGPMAQDFHAAFGLGQNDTTIATVDESGVALAAIQALHQQNTELRKQVEELKARLDAMDANR